MHTAEELLAPCSAACPCGVDLSFSAELDAIAAARKEDDPDLDQGEWVTALRKADWPFVAAQCAELLRARSKDLRLAVWLAEAWAHTHHLRGLGNGCMLLAGLCERYWEQLHPLPDGGEQEQRIGNIAWLLARLPGLLRELPLADDDAGGCSPEFSEMLVHDVRYCLAAFQSWQLAVDARLGLEGPSFSAAAAALQDLAGRLNASAPAPLTGTASQRLPLSATVAGALASREQALEQLRAVAAYFRSAEPHSPVAYLADKAARWGEMPLHEWLRAVVKDPALQAQLDDLLGV